uniref:Conserved hypothetical plastid protein n=1 Tax=Corynoplastis japonica TaxID=700918 RepID=A0A1X9PVZ1_9RHOD|nr:conserved hypothetical plastid protein [Corynoplastis japonica]
MILPLKENDYYPPSPVPRKSKTINIQELTRNYFEQTIIFSPLDKKGEPSVLERDRNQISRDCLTQKINFELPRNFLHNSITNRLRTGKQITYAWKKGINLPFPKQDHQLIVKSNRFDFPTIKQEQIINKLRNFPVFVVSNGFKELVIGYSQNEYKKNYYEKIYDLYDNYFLWTKDKYPSSLGFFFFNPNDALELEKTMYNRQPYSSKELCIKTNAISLHKAYALNRTSSPRVQFKFVPDLDELGKLLKEYKYDSNIRFHPKQYHGRSFFQGQPIYMIQPNWIQKLNNKKILKEYNTLFKAKSENSTVIFISRDSAYLGWKKFRTVNPKLNLPKKPPLIVYNFESFINDYECDSNKASTDLVLVTNHDAYNYFDKLKMNQNSETSFEALSNKFNTNFLFLKIWIKRILWSITTTHSPM